MGVSFTVETSDNQTESFVTFTLAAQYAASMRAQGLTAKLYRVTKYPAAKLLTAA